MQPAIFGGTAIEVYGKRTNLGQLPPGPVALCLDLGNFYPCVNGTLKVKSSPPEHGMPYRTSWRQCLTSHRSSLLRWTHSVLSFLLTTDNTRHTEFIAWSWSAVRLYHANHAVWWRWWCYYVCRTLLCQIFG